MAITPTKIGGFTNSGATSSASIVATLTAGASIGDDVFFFCYAGGGKTLSSVTDSAGGNTWVVDGTFNNAGATVAVGLARCKLSTALTTSNTVTGTISGAAIPRFATVFKLVGGNLAATPFDASATGGATPGSHVMTVGPTAALAQSDELAFGCYAWNESVAGTSMTADAPNAILDQGVSENAGAAGRAGGIEWQETAATTAITDAPTSSTNATVWVGQVLTYKVSVAATPQRRPALIVRLPNMQPIRVRYPLSANR